VEFFCEESFIDTTCAAPTPTPTPTPSCEPPDEQPNLCCKAIYYQPDPNLSGRCVWNCSASDNPQCAGETLNNGCIVVSGPVVCDDDYRFTSLPGGGYACPSLDALDGRVRAGV